MASWLYTWIWWFLTASRSLTGTGDESAQFSQEQTAAQRKSLRVCARRLFAYVLRVVARDKRSRSVGVTWGNIVCGSSLLGGFVNRPVKGPGMPMIIAGEWPGMAQAERSVGVGSDGHSGALGMLAGGFTFPCLGQVDTGLLTVLRGFPHPTHSRENRALNYLITDCEDLVRVVAQGQ